MEAHNEIRKKAPIWGLNQTNIVNYLLGPCKLKDKATEDLLHTICGIIEINAFEARSVNGNSFRILYPKLALMSHNCVSNICHSIHPINDKGEEYRYVLKLNLLRNIIHETLHLRTLSWTKGGQLFG